MKHFTFEIPGKLPSLNDIIRLTNRNRFVGARQKKEETSLCAYHIMVCRVPKFKGPVSIIFDWVEPNAKRDIDNVAGGGEKFILDALVQTGRLVNDSRKYVKEIKHIFVEIDKRNPRVIVTIEEWNDKNRQRGKK